MRSLLPLLFLLFVASSAAAQAAPDTVTTGRARVGADVGRPEPTRPPSVVVRPPVPHRRPDYHTYPASAYEVWGTVIGCGGVGFVMAARERPVARPLAALGGCMIGGFVGYLVGSVLHFTA